MPFDWEGNFPILSSFYNTIRTFAETLALNIWKGVNEPIDYFVDKLHARFSVLKIKDEDQAWNDMLQFYVEAGLLTNPDKANIAKLKHLGHPFDWITFLNTATKLFGFYCQSVIEPAMMLMNQRINKEMRGSLPPVQEIMEAAFVAPEKTGMVRDAMARMGIPDDYIDLMFLSRYRRYDESSIRDLWLRKVLTNDKMYERMRELGYTDTRTQELMGLWSIIPPVTDLLHMVGKEAFEPDAIAAMGLDTDFPEEQSEWLEKQGLSRYWQMKYWIAHWEQPSIQMGYEMLHRGIIDEQMLDVLYRTVEIPPYWREKLTAIAYSPYTRVDVRRMHDMGVIDDDGLIKAYKDLGYDDEHADKMAEFTKKYNQGSAKELTKAEILKAYKLKAMSLNDALDLLTGIGFSNDLANYYLTMEDYNEELSLQDELIADVRDRYINRVIDRSSASSMLDALNLPSAQRNMYLDRWDIQLYKGKKFPSRSDLDSFYVNDIITEDQYRNEMDRLGYQLNHVDWYLTQVNMVKAKKQKVNNQ